MAVSNPAPSRLAAIERARRDVMLDDAPGGATAVAPWITQSWQRCLQRGQRPQDSIGFDVVSAATVRRTLESARSLREAAASVLADLSRAIAPTGYFSVLTDHLGTVVAAGASNAHDHPAAHAITRIGVDLSEASIGTTAISAALGELQPVWLHGGEHFFDATSLYSCAGAPIFGPDARCAGMLDLTGVHAQERPELRHLAARMAQRVEQALLLQLPHCRWFQVQWPGAPEAPGAALLAVDRDGRVAGASRSACAMLGLQREPDGGSFGALDAVFATPADRLLGLTPRHAALQVSLWSGLQVLVASASTDGQRNLDAPARLRDAQAELIRRAVDSARGNVADAARQLGVSRATVYRRMKQRPPDKA